MCVSPILSRKKCDENNNKNTKIETERTSSGNKVSRIRMCSALHMYLGCYVHVRSIQYICFVLVDVEFYAESIRLKLCINSLFFSDMQRVVDSHNFTIYRYTQGEL